MTRLSAYGATVIFAAARLVLAKCRHEGCKMNKYCGRQAFLLAAVCALALTCCTDDCNTDEREEYMIDLEVCAAANAAIVDYIRWGPDNQTIFMVGDRQLFAMEYAEFSPDCKHLLYWDNCQPDWERCSVHVFNIETESEVFVDNNARMIYGRFSPDGQKVIYSRNWRKSDPYELPDSMDIYWHNLTTGSSGLIAEDIPWELEYTHNSRYLLFSTDYWYCWRSIDAWKSCRFTYSLFDFDSETAKVILQDVYVPLFYAVSPLDDHVFFFKDLVGKDYGTGDLHLYKLATEETSMIATGVGYTDSFPFIGGSQWVGYSVSNGNEKPRLSFMLQHLDTGEVRSVAENYQRDLSLNTAETHLSYCSCTVGPFDTGLSWNWFCFLYNLATGKKWGGQYSFTEYPHLALSNIDGRIGIFDLELRSDVSPGIIKEVYPKPSGARWIRYIDSNGAHLLSRIDGTGRVPLPISEESIAVSKLSPDGKQLAYLQNDEDFREEDYGPVGNLSLVDVQQGTTRPIAADIKSYEPVQDGCFASTKDSLAPRAYYFDYKSKKLVELFADL